MLSPFQVTGYQGLLQSVIHILHTQDASTHFDSTVEASASILNNELKVRPQTVLHYGRTTVNSCFSKLWETLLTTGYQLSIGKRENNIQAWHVCGPDCVNTRPLATATTAGGR